MLKLMVTTRMFVDKMAAKLHREEGQGLVEYGLILALVAVVVVVALKTLGGEVNGKLTEVTDGLKSATP